MVFRSLVGQKEYKASVVFFVLGSVLGLGFRGQGSGLRAWGLGFRDSDLEFRV